MRAMRIVEIQNAIFTFFEIEDIREKIRNKLKNLKLCKNVSGYEQRYESVADSDSNLWNHIFSFVSAPYHIWDSERYDKCYPYHKSSFHARIFWNCTDDTCEADDHEECSDEFADHDFPEPLHHRFFCFFIHTIHTMDTLPLFAEQYTEPEMTKHKADNRHDDNHWPIKSLHKKRNKRYQPPQYTLFFYSSRNYSILR